MPHLAARGGLMMAIEPQGCCRKSHPPRTSAVIHAPDMKRIRAPGTIEDGYIANGFSEEHKIAHLPRTQIGYPHADQTTPDQHQAHEMGIAH